MRRDWNDKSPRARQCSNRINSPPGFSNRRKIGRNNNFSMPGPIFEMVESTRGGGERNDPSSVNVSRFPDRNFDRIKEIVIYSVSLVRRYTRMVIQFSRVFPPALDRLSLDRSASGHFSPVQARDVVCFASKRLQSQLNWQATSKSRAARLVEEQ